MFTTTNCQLSLVASAVLIIFCSSSSMTTISAFCPTTPTFLLDRRHQPQQRQQIDKSNSETSSLLWMAPRGRGPPVKENRPPMNDEIKAQELRVVAPNPKGKDEPLGIMNLNQALEKAQEMGGLDLILVNDKSDPPVCKIVDYSKYRYMQEKKAKEIKKKSKASELKEVKMSYKIDIHDYEVRKKNADKFLQQGNRVKCTVMFRGREVQHDQLGFELLEKLAEDLEKTCVKEGRPKKEGRNLSLILSPRPEVLKAVSDKRKASEKEKKKNKKAAFEEKLAAKESKATATNINGVNTANGEKTEKDDDMEASLDELLGRDVYMDDIFN